MSINKDSLPSVDQLFKDFEHPNPNINRSACICMKELYPQESISKLIRNLDTKDVDLRRKSVICLSYFGEEVFLPISNLFYSTNNNITRVSCLKVFIKLASFSKDYQSREDLFDLIKIAIEDNSYEMILTAISLLRQLENKSIPFLKKLCRDNNMLKAKASITAISELNDTSILSFLNELAEDDSLDKFIREAAIDAISLKK